MKVDRLAGKRLADQLLSASDVDRANFSARAIGMTVRRHGARRAAYRADFEREHNTNYSVKTPATAIRDQKQTGRCWLFTALAVVERDIELRSGKQVKLSRAYINARNLQYSAYALIKEGAEVNSLASIADNDLGEGGQFDYALRFINKYGVVPERVMRDFKDSTDSATIIKLLETEIARAQEQLRQTGQDSPQVAQIVKEAQRRIDHIIAFGFTGKTSLPENFLVDGMAFTPQTYAEHLDIKASNYVTLDASPRLRRGWRSWGSGPHHVEVYNVGDVKTLLQQMRNTIDQGRKFYIALPVAGASAPYMVPHSAKFGNGVMSLSAFDYKSLGMPEPITDRAILQARRLTPASHAMTGTGYDERHGEVIKWGIDNSWGQTGADHGRQHAYNDFVSAFVGTTAMSKLALDPQLLQRMEAEKAAADQIVWFPK